MLIPSSPFEIRTKYFYHPVVRWIVRILSYGGLLLVNVLYASYSLVSMGPLHRVDPVLFVCFQTVLLAPIGFVIAVEGQEASHPREYLSWSPVRWVPQCRIVVLYALAERYGDDRGHGLLNSEWDCCHLHRLEGIWTTYLDADQMGVSVRIGRSCPCLVYVTVGMAR